MLRYRNMRSGNHHSTNHMYSTADTRRKPLFRIKHNARPHLCRALHARAALGYVAQDARVWVGGHVQVITRRLEPG